MTSQRRHPHVDSTSRHRGQACAPPPAPDGERLAEEGDRQEEAFEVPDSWTQLVLELMLEGPMTALEHEARAAAQTPRVLN